VALFCGDCFCGGEGLKIGNKGRSEKVPAGFPVQGRIS
jgi:hypothetical protein